MTPAGDPKQRRIGGPPLKEKYGKLRKNVPETPETPKSLIFIFFFPPWVFGVLSGSMTFLDLLRSISALEFPETPF